jgi:enolase-phosphatase E1
MSIQSPPATRIESILLDIEGTTTPIDYVYNILFPYARARVDDYLDKHASSEEVRAIIDALSEEHAADMRNALEPPLLSDNSPEAKLRAIKAYVYWLMDGDRKSTPLKSLQGMIWESGYQNGEIRSQVFNDVPPNLKRWDDLDKTVCIFSSGSVLAQKLLFAHTTAGDLTKFIQGYFDTRIGSKTETESYRQIARALGITPSAIIFVSDVSAELDAARRADMHTLLCVRPGNHPQPATSTHEVIKSFDAIRI